jgi:hypothetical protein
MARSSSFDGRLAGSAVAAALLLARCALAVAGTAPEGRFGLVLAGDEKSRSICFALAGAAPKPGDGISVVLLDAPQRALRATVGEPVDGCGEPLPAAEPHYRATLEVDPPASRMLAGSAVVTEPHEVVQTERRVAGADHKGVARGTIAVRFAGEEDEIRFRECASSEGLHVTAWRDEPLRGQRIWHAYFYLGYDVEPDCEAAEVARSPLSHPSERV